MQEEIVFRFPDEGVTASARLLREQAPETCSAVLGAACRRLRATRHLLGKRRLSRPFRDPRTAARACDDDRRPRRRRLPHGYGIEESYSEICWFYDLDATPSMPEGPVAVNVFARLHDADEFFAVCRRMRLEGTKPVEVARAPA